MQSFECSLLKPGLVHSVQHFLMRFIVILPFFSLILTCGSTLITRLTLNGIQKDCFPTLAEAKRNVDHLYNLLITGNTSALCNELYSNENFSERVASIGYSVLQFISDASLI